MPCYMWVDVSRGNSKLAKRTINCFLLRTCVLKNTCWRYDLTVETEIPRREAISASECPLQTKTVTSRSRVESEFQ